MFGDYAFLQGFFGCCSILEQIWQKKGRAVLPLAVAPFSFYFLRFFQTLIINTLEMHS